MANNCEQPDPNKSQNLTPDNNQVIRPERNMPEDRSAKGQSDVSPFPQQSKKKIRSLGSFSSTNKDYQQVYLDTVASRKSNDFISEDYDHSIKRPDTVGETYTEEGKKYVDIKTTDNRNNKFINDIDVASDRESKYNEQNLNTEVTKKDQPSVTIPNKRKIKLGETEIEFERNTKKENTITIGLNRQQKHTEKEVKENHTEKERPDVSVPTDRDIKLQEKEVRENHTEKTEKDVPTTISVNKTLTDVTPDDVVESPKTENQYQRLSDFIEDTIKLNNEQELGVYSSSTQKEYNQLGVYISPTKKTEDNISTPITNEMKDENEVYNDGDFSDPSKTEEEINAQDSGIEKTEEEINAQDPGIEKTESEINAQDPGIEKTESEINAQDPGIEKTEKELETESMEFADNFKPHEWEVDENVSFSTYKEKTEGEINAQDPGIEKTESEINAQDPGIEKTESEINTLINTKEKTEEEINAQDPGIEKTEEEINAQDPGIEKTEEEIDTTYDIDYNEKESDTPEKSAIEYVGSDNHRYTIIREDNNPNQIRDKQFPKLDVDGEGTEWDDYGNTEYPEYNDDTSSTQSLNIDKENAIAVNKRINYGNVSTRGNRDTFAIDNLNTGSKEDVYNKKGREQYKGDEEEYYEPRLGITTNFNYTNIFEDEFMEEGKVADKNSVYPTTWNPADADIEQGSFGLGRAFGLGVNNYGAANYTIPAFNEEDAVLTNKDIYVDPDSYAYFNADFIKETLSSISPGVDRLTDAVSDGIGNIKNIIDFAGNIGQDLVKNSLNINNDFLNGIRKDVFVTGVKSLSGAVFDSTLYGKPWSAVEDLLGNAAEFVEGVSDFAENPVAESLDLIKKGLLRMNNAQNDINKYTRGVSNSGDIAVWGFGGSDPSFSYDDWKFTYTKSLGSSPSQVGFGSGGFNILEGLVGNKKYYSLGRSKFDQYREQIHLSNLVSGIAATLDANIGLSYNGDFDPEILDTMPMANTDRPELDVPKFVANMVLGNEEDQLPYNRNQYLPQLALNATINSETYNINAERESNVSFDVPVNAGGVRRPHGPGFVEITATPYRQFYFTRKPLNYEEINQGTFEVNNGGVMGKGNERLQEYIKKESYAPHLNRFFDPLPTEDNTQFLIAVNNSKGESGVGIPLEDADSLLNYTSVSKTIEAPPFPGFFPEESIEWNDFYLQTFNRNFNIETQNNAIKYRSQEDAANDNLEVNPAGGSQPVDPHFVEVSATSINSNDSNSNLIGKDLFYSQTKNYNFNLSQEWQKEGDKSDHNLLSKAQTIVKNNASSIEKITPIKYYDNDKKDLYIDTLFAESDLSYTKTNYDNEVAENEDPHFIQYINSNSSNKLDEFGLRGKFFDKYSEKPKIAFLNNSFKLQDIIDRVKNGDADRSDFIVTVNDDNTYYNADDGERSWYDNFLDTWGGVITDRSVNIIPDGEKPFEGNNYVDPHLIEYNRSEDTSSNPHEFGPKGEFWKLLSNKDENHLYDTFTDLSLIKNITVDDQEIIKKLTHTRTSEDFSEMWINNVKGYNGDSGISLTATNMIDGKKANTGADNQINPHLVEYNIPEERSDLSAIQYGPKGQFYKKYNENENIFNAFNDLSLINNIEADETLKKLTNTRTTEDLSKMWVNFVKGFNANDVSLKLQQTNISTGDDIDDEVVDPHLITYNNKRDEEGKTFNYGPRKHFNDYLRDSGNENIYFISPSNENEQSIFTNFDKGEFNEYQSTFVSKRTSRPLWRERTEISAEQGAGGQASIQTDLDSDPKGYVGIGGRNSGNSDYEYLINTIQTISEWPDPKEEEKEIRMDTIFADAWNEGNNAPTIEGLEQKDVSSPKNKPTKWGRPEEDDTLGLTLPKLPEDTVGPKNIDRTTKKKPYAIRYWHGDKKSDSNFEQPALTLEGDEAGDSKRGHIKLWEDADIEDNNIVYDADKADDDYSSFLQGAKAQDTKDAMTNRLSQKLRYSFLSWNNERVIDTEDDQGNGKLVAIKNMYKSYWDSDNHLFSIPFQFLAELTGENRSADWTTQTAVGRTAEYFIWSKTGTRTLQLKTTYAVMNGENRDDYNRFYENWGLLWTEDKILQTLNYYRSLLLPITKDLDNDAPMSPPIFVIIAGNHLMTSSAIEQPDGKRLSRWVAQDMNIDPKYELGFTKTRTPIAFDISFTMKEVFGWSDYQSYNKIRANLGM